MPKVSRAGNSNRSPADAEISRLSVELDEGLDSLDAGRVVSGGTLRQEIATFLAARRGANPGMGR
ncbi:hypothetical protein JL100_008815 [Skermanella mucosa]|uniref:hypothetical protein n=1 Tax=Skermanella mucosa TaxID=1789672 RepID=UPI00192CBE27|nr:hypothetical protein [Skermanella mucosa]UEM22829.1 hypothetical protein JL100_008815 [Skermanella mucosa]